MGYILCGNPEDDHPSYPDDRTVFIMQGVPGSGKSTVAQMLTDTIHRRGYSLEYLSTDEYWYNRGMGSGVEAYAFDPTLLPEAHQWNQKRCIEAMKSNVSYIIIDNTNIKGSQALPYRVFAETYGYSVMVVSVDCGLDEAVRRNALRPEDRQVPEEFIRTKYNEMERLMT